MAAAPFRAATPVEAQARAAVVRADYRYDDLLWENDCAAYRIYGRALEAAEPPSGSGIDAWGKSVAWPFMDRQLRTGDQHSNHGEGLDFYNVGAGRGAGGLGIWSDNKLWTSRNYDRVRVHAPGPNLADFTADYAPWPVGIDRWVSETRRFTLRGGTPLTRMVVTLSSNRPEELLVGIGIGKRTTDPVKTGSFEGSAATGRFRWQGPEDPVRGAMTVMLLVDPSTIAKVTSDSDNYLVIVRATPGRPFVYYAGASWSLGRCAAESADWDRTIARLRPDFTVGD